MTQIIFLDTNTILDYLENRNQEVRDVIAQLLLLHKKDKIILATSVINIAELIDTEFQIRFIGTYMSERLSYDEINKLRGNKKLFKQIADKNKGKIEKKIIDFIVKKKIVIFNPLFNDDEQYKDLYKLLYDHQLQSQDALIVATALLNNVTYFLSNDSNLVNSISELLDSYNLRNKNRLEDFRNNVLEAI